MKDLCCERKPKGSKQVEKALDEQDKQEIDRLFENNTKLAPLEEMTSYN